MTYAPESSEQFNGSSAESIMAAQTSGVLSSIGAHINSSDMVDLSCLHNSASNGETSYSSANTPEPHV